jgi:TrmH family RNA methyltransferase
MFFRSCFLCGGMTYNSSLLDPSELERLRVVLVATRNPLNIGAAARAMSNFGFRHLRVVNPYDRAFREARSAVGASALLASAEEYATLADAVADCVLVVGTTAAGNREIHHPLRRLEHAVPLIRDASAAGNVALLFGSEKRGLKNEDLSHCHWLLRIPTRDEHGSMNLGQAVALCLYEIIRNATAVLPNDEASPACAETLERLNGVLFQALSISGYLNSHSAEVKLEKVRRMLRRIKLSESDAEIWLGMLRQIIWKLRGGGSSKDSS